MLCCVTDLFSTEVLRRTESRRYWPGMVAMQSIATTTDDLKDREINAGEIHGVHPK
jgi:hypothetical protein